MKLTLSEMAEFAEVIAAIAIVISLLFVGVQIQSNTQAILSGNANVSATLTQNWYAAMGHDLEAVTILRRGLWNPTELNPDEMAQFIFLVHSITLVQQNAYYLWKQGTLDIDLGQSITQSMLAVKDQPGFKLYWIQRKSYFTEEFINFVENDIFSSTQEIEASAIYNNSETSPE